jgi:hypothetical protein
MACASRPVAAPCWLDQTGSQPQATLAADQNIWTQVAICVLLTEAIR